MLLALLVLRRVTPALRRLADRLRFAHLSPGATAWLASGRWRDDWQLTPVVLWVSGAGLTAAVVTLGAWYLLRGGEEGGRRWPHAPVPVAAVILCLTLGSLTLWSLTTTA